jgi:hypothetical protein
MTCRVLMRRNHRLTRARALSRVQYPPVGGNDHVRESVENLYAQPIAGGHPPEQRESTRENDLEIEGRYLAGDPLGEARAGEGRRCA